MSSDQYPSLKFCSGQFLFEFQDETGTHKRFISPAAVRKAFAGTSVDSGWLAPNVIRYGAATAGDWAVMEIAAGMRRILLEDGAKQSYIRIPLPRLIIFGLGAKWHVWALRDNVALAQAEVFAAPLPNLHQDGHICFGSNKPPRASGLSIAKAWELFITSPFNGDLTGQKSKKHTDIRVHLRELARKKATEYPAADLVKLRKAGGLDSLIKSLTGDGQFAVYDEPDF